MDDFNHEFLQNYGGAAQNDLRKIINDESDNNNINASLNPSDYHDLDDMAQVLVSKEGDFKIFSFNAESLASKIDRLKIFMKFLSEKNIYFDAICINECWIDSFGDDLEIEGYNAHVLSRKVGYKGGLVTYVLKEYDVKPLEMYEDSMS